MQAGAHKQSAGNNENQKVGAADKGSWLEGEATGGL